VPVCRKFTRKEVIEMQDEQSSIRAIPRPTLERLPKYLNYLRAKSEQGQTQTSAVSIAQDMQLTSIQVRKDLAFITSGKPRVGHDILQLIERLENFLQCNNNTRDAVLVGAGHLGKALLSYGGFDNYKLRILAAFDSDESLAGTSIHGKPVYHNSRLSELTARLNAMIGIIAVPAPNAQSVCDALVKGGIKGILNFAPVYLSVPKGVIVRNEDIAASMALLANSIQETCALSSEDDE